MENTFIVIRNTRDLYSTLYSKYIDREMEGGVFPQLLLNMDMEEDFAYRSEYHGIAFRSGLPYSYILTTYDDLTKKVLLYNNKIQPNIISYYGLISNISTVLKIKNPNIVFMDYSEMNSGGLFNPKSGRIFIANNQGFINSVLSIAHEMRHFWQMLYHQKIFFDDYKALTDPSDFDSYVQYNLQKAEVDANAFSIRYLNEYSNIFLTDINFD